MSRKINVRRLRNVGGNNPSEDLPWYATRNHVGNQKKGGIGGINKCARGLHPANWEGAVRLRRVRGPFFRRFTWPPKSETKIVMYDFKKICKTQERHVRVCVYYY